MVLLIVIGTADCEFRTDRPGHAACCCITARGLLGAAAVAATAVAVVPSEHASRGHLLLLAIVSDLL